MRGLLLVDGPSDIPLSTHLERIAFKHGIDLTVTAPDLRRLEPSPGYGVAARLRAVLAIDQTFDVVLVHRDAEAQDPEVRRSEIDRGVDDVRPGLARVPVIPVRMTEAWLLVDEQAIRQVAGRPGSTIELNLPPLVSVEATADPKSILARALNLASGCSGRRLQRFARDFGEHRRLLLERIDHAGPVTQLAAWRRFGG